MRYVGKYGVQEQIGERVDRLLTAACAIEDAGFDGVAWLGSLQEYRPRVSPSALVDEAAVLWALAAWEHATRPDEDETDDVAEPVWEGGVSP